MITNKLAITKTAPITTGISRVLSALTISFPHPTHKTIMHFPAPVPRQWAQFYGQDVVEQVDALLMQMKDIVNIEKM